MTASLKKILAASRCLSATTDVPLIEDESRLDVVGSLGNPKARSLWGEIARSEREWVPFCAVKFYYQIDNDEIDIHDVAAETIESEILVQISKKSAEKSCFFTADGFIKHLDRSRILQFCNYQVVECASGFRTLAFSVQEWAEEATAETRGAENLTEPLIDARRLVKDLSTGSLVPDDCRKWLLVNQPGEICATFQRWRLFAQRALLCSLATEVNGDSATVELTFQGPVKRTLSFSSTADEIAIDAFYQLTECARWVLLPERERELRHTLLANEFARHGIGSRTYGELISEHARSVLEAARLSYRAHVLGQSKETLKSISDLRKAVADEIGKVAEQTRALSVTLWADFTVALAVIALRYFAFARTDLPIPQSARLFIGLVGVYLITHVAIRIWSNWQNFLALDETIRIWHSRIYSFLTQSEFEDLVKNPIDRTKETYSVTAVYVGLMYVILSVFVLAFALA
ncbi:hypothetical protein [Salinarimonas chemoclinalis]|uniref:hypothetical protein n=1 Tax=Salinarimonas chemoclinalis TaxID=3241599 RepID=UPI0035565253